MVTGVHLISDGRVHSGWGVASEIHGTVNVDPGTASGGVPTGQTAANLQGSLRGSVQMENEFGQTGERVWCAQFMELAVDFTNGPQKNPSQGFFTRLFAKKEIEILQLRQVEDLGVGGVRRARTSAKDLAFPPSSSSTAIDWKHHQAMILGLQTADPITSTDDDVHSSDTPESLGSDEPLGEMVVSDVPYDQGLSREDWETFEDYLAYLEYQK